MPCRGADVIRDQIEVREQARLLEGEKRDQETQSMLRYLERLQQEDINNLVKKKEAQHKLMEEVAKCNEVMHVHCACMWVLEELGNCIN